MGKDRTRWLMETKERRSKLKLKPMREYLPKSKIKAPGVSPLVFVKVRLLLCRFDKVESHNSPETSWICSLLQNVGFMCSSPSSTLTGRFIYVTSSRSITIIATFSKKKLRFSGVLGIDPVNPKRINHVLQDIPRRSAKDQLATENLVLLDILGNSHPSSPPTGDHSRVEGLRTKHNDQ